MIGRTLSHYSVLDRLGEGGMGVVYRARDLHLDRLVAVKVLPREKVTDPERKRRFVQEARAASALQHPGIVSVYDIDEADGVPFIAMELVAGRTLADVIGRKGLPVATALRIAIQVADALAAAHAAGIVHRDLKPANVMVAESGQVKLLDFGLAKLTALEPAGASAQEMPTLAAGTAEGVIVGTVAYMSPEQAEGQKVDARSDVFSFGAVLHEMLAGRSAFGRATPTATLAAVLRDEPERLEGVPRELERIVARCLRKEPARRFQTVADLKVSLEEVLDDLSSGAGAAGPAAAPPRRSGRRVGAAAAACALVAAGLALGWSLRPERQAATPPVPLTSYAGILRAPALSPDGRQVAFSWNGEKEGAFGIHVKLVGPGPPLRLTNDPAGDAAPAWSPDGASIAFLRRVDAVRSAILVVPAMGGPERKVAEGMFDYRIAWSHDGSTLFVPARDSVAAPLEISTVSLGTGERRRLTRAPAGAWAGDVAPAVSPDGRTLAFARSMTRANSQIHVLALTPDLAPAGEPHPVTVNGITCLEPAWSPDGKRIVYSRGGGGASANPFLEVVPASGGPSKGERLPFGEGGEAPTVAASGRVVYLRATRDENVWRLALPARAESPPERLVFSTRRDLEPRYSPDGSRITFASDRTGSLQVWVCRSDGSDPRPVTTMSASVVGGARWSPDGRSIVFVSNLEGQQELYLTTPEGRTPVRLTNDPAHDSAPSFSRDGRWVYFASNRQDGFQVWKMAPEPGAAPVRVTRGGGFAALESPDGKTLYYARRQERSGWGIWSVPVAGGEEREVVPALGSWGDFDVTAAGLVYVDSPRAGAGLHLLRTDGSSDTLLARLTRRSAFGVSASPDGGSVLWSQFDVESTELMLVDGFR